jgi:hypothetical protein
MVREQGCLEKTIRDTDSERMGFILISGKAASTYQFT